MPRLFAAIDPPDRICEQIGAIRIAEIQARWVTKHNVHLTLKFIGQVDEQRARDVRNALGRVEEEAPLIAPSMFVAFPSWRRPTVLALTVAPDERLMAIQKNVDDVLQHAGIPAEKRPFRPHITIARLKNANPAMVRRIVRDCTPPEVPPFRAASFFLYESRLRPSGAEYIRIAEYPLTPFTHP